MKSQPLSQLPQSIKDKLCKQKAYWKFDLFYSQEDEKGKVTFKGYVVKGGLTEAEKEALQKLGIFYRSIFDMRFKLKFWKSYGVEGFKQDIIPEFYLTVEEAHETYGDIEEIAKGPKGGFRCAFYERALFYDSYYDNPNFYSEEYKAELQDLEDAKVKKETPKKAEQELLF